MFVQAKGKHNHRYLLLCVICQSERAGSSRWHFISCCWPWGNQRQRNQLPSANLFCCKHILLDPGCIEVLMKVNRPQLHLPQRHRFCRGIRCIWHDNDCWQCERDGWPVRPCKQLHCEGLLQHFKCCVTTTKGDSAASTTKGLPLQAQAVSNSLWKKWQQQQKQQQQQQQQQGLQIAPTMLNDARHHLHSKQQLS
jgi:hypothetical protein